MGFLMSRAVVVLGHGSRSAEANAEFQQIVGMLRQRLDADLVLPAHMELAEPSLSDAVALAVERGASEIVVLACFLFPGNHMKRDIPERLSEIRERYPQITLRFSRPLGADPRIADVLHERMEEASCLP